MAKQMLAAPKPSVMFGVDYPRQDETITGREYAIRVNAPQDVDGVEIAVDQGDWLPCRRAAGYWWYDWSGYENGEHEVVVRIELPGGRRLIAEPHEFFVALPA